jgi:PAS domain S-box-containing protein
MMGIPLISDGQVFGLMEISRDKPFTELDLQRLVTIAGQITNIIKRKQAEEALKKSEEKFAKAFHSSPNPTSISTMEVDRCLDMNESFTTFTGYGRDEIIGCSVGAMDLWVEPADRTRLAQMLQEQGKVRDLEVKLRAKSGDIKLGLISAELIDISGEPCILATGRDITEQKRAEKALQESEEKLRELAESITDVFFAMDEQLRYTYWNRASEELTGISAENALGKHLLDLFPDSEQTRTVEEFYRKVLRTNKPDSSVNKYQLGDKEFFFEINAYPTRNGLSVFVKDISEQKRAEEALQESEEKMRQMFNSVSDGIVVTDLDGIIINANDRLLEMHGFGARDEVIGKNASEFNAPFEQDKTIANIQNLLAGELVKSTEFTLLRADGSTFPVELSMSLLKDASGKPIGFITVGRDITERKQAEAALQESEEKLRQTFKSVTDGLVVTNLDGFIVDFNDRILEMHGFGSRDELIGKHGTELSALFERDRVIENEQTMLEGGSVKSNEYALLRADGSTFPVELSMSLLKDASGKPIGFVTVGRDITERKRAEGKHQAIIKTALDGFCLGDLEGRFLEINDSYCQMTGYSREELLKMSTADIEASDTPEEMGQRLQLIKQRGYDFFETRLRRKDGKIIDVEISVNYLEMDNGQVCVFIRDITERKQAEALFRTMAKSSPIGIYIVQDGKFQFTNPQFQRQVGRSEEELIGTDALSFVAPEDRERVRENATRMLKGELSQPYEYRSLDGRGEVRWVLETVAPIDYHGKRATVGNHMDITEHKMLEQEQQRLGKLESIGTLAGGIAHDFNNILTGIMGNISLALRSIAPDGKVAERLLEAEKASLRAKDLTHRLLTFARGGAPIKKTISIADLIRESTDLALRGSNTRCEYSLPDKLWTVEADEGQINQVFTNLTINASEAMPEGGTLHITARNMVNNKRKGPLPLPRGNYVEITVKDQGTGIAKGHLERIFEPYFTTKQKGSGLGLATAYSVIKNHDGHISVSSELGTGTTFTIYLPASSKPAPVKKKVVAEAPIPGKGRVLVMDDEPAIRQLLKRMLTGTGYEIELSQDGKEAIAKYTQAREADRPFEAVIMDLTVPGGMGGKETISNLLEIDPGVKAIVSSGYSTDPIMADYDKYGFSGVVAKPYVAADLEKTLRNVIQGINA